MTHFLRGSAAAVRRATSLTLVSGLLHSALAQQPPLHRPGRIAVTVAVTDAGFRGQDAVILRRFAEGHPNVVVLSRAAGPRALADAALALVTLMEREGEVARTPAAVSVVEATGTPRAEVAVAARVLAGINASSRTIIPGVGEASIGYMYLPAARMRATLRPRGKLTRRRVAD